MIRSVLFVLLVGTSGCTLVADSLLHGPVADCTGALDGTPCKDAELCVQGTCIYSACGDGFLDRTRGEACDDANLVSGDGCEPGLCRYSCELDVQCEDANPCRATTGCDVGTHRCKPFVATSGAECMRLDGTLGVCKMGVCPPAGCGDGILAAPEECDDDSPGCSADCTFVCETDGECLTDDLCTAPLMCDVASHTCVDAPPVVCDDMDACTSDACDPIAACGYGIIDADLDGVSPGMCAEGSAATGGDCDDTNMDIRPGAPELVDGIDQDCDDVIDENPGVNCLRDVDGDGYGNPAMMMFASSCPDGYVAPRVRNDCHDQNANVNPGQTVASTFPYCPPGATLMGSAASGFACSGNGSPSPTWDWNCDGMQRPTIATTRNCGDGSTCGGTGWVANVPPCGGTGTIVTCTLDCLLVICNCNGSNTPNVPQYCL